MSSAFNMRRRRRKPAINITSLIDVMFLLLIFFMVSSTFRHQLGIDVQLPDADTAAMQEMRSHEIVVTERGEYYFGQRKVDEEELREAIVRALEPEPTASLVLRADERADFGKVIRAIDIARDVGGTQLIIPTEYQRDRKE
ncbi:MAG TPA: biopolymer transporter ExbD [Candidatus Hydrogenedentes bacterium]|nr:biopolymer transporter ExbD [Candidatus Hydrogenedentota bacterium]HIJ74325.1 biopolymer transporter ExbD [Candidatus Hydrogenedentota bacterium]